MNEQQRRLHLVYSSVAVMFRPNPQDTPESIREGLENLVRATQENNDPDAEKIYKQALEIAKTLGVIN